MQLTRERTREIADEVRGRWVRLLDPTAVGSDKVLYGFNVRHYGDDDAFVSYIGNSNGYAVANVVFAAGGSATVTMDRIAEVYPDPDEYYEEEYDSILAQQELEDFAQDGEFENLSAEEVY